MKQSMGGITMLNIIIIFIVLVFAFVAGTISYYKAYKVNRQILNSIERYEGYNGGAQSEADKALGSLGYNPAGSNSCAKTFNDNGVTGYLVEKGNTIGAGLSGLEDYTNNAIGTLEDKAYDYCVYIFKDTDGRNATVKGNSILTNYYYSYGVVSYITIDLPIINNTLRIRVFTRTEKIYKFTTNDL